MKRARTVETPNRRRGAAKPGRRTEREQVEAREPAARKLTDDELDAVAGGRDAASGMPTGQRMHKPWTLV